MQAFSYSEFFGPVQRATERWASSVRTEKKTKRGGLDSQPASRVQQVVARSYSPPPTPTRSGLKLPAPMAGPMISEPVVTSEIGSCSVQPLASHAASKSTE